MTLRVLDLFSGIGGFSLGLERTGGFRTVAFCEIEPFPRAVLRKHWPDVPCFEDVRNLRAEHVGAVDVICGGFPCQDISLAGRGAGLGGKRSGLWWEYHRLIDECRPSWVIAENVSALRSRGLDQVLRSLAEIGYDAEWHCIPASALDAPHQRDRIWIVAYPACELPHGGGAQGAGRDQPSDGGEALAYAYEPRLQGRISEFLRQCSPEWTPGESGASRIFGQWLPEPDVGRVADGVPARVHRLRALGNAIVPKAAQVIGQAILAAEGLI